MALYGLKDGDPCSSFGLPVLPDFNKVPHRARELEANGGLLLRLAHRVALKVPELDIVPFVSGQEGHRNLDRNRLSKTLVRCL